MVLNTIRAMDRRQLVFAVLFLVAMGVVLVVVTASIVGAQKTSEIRAQQKTTAPLIENTNRTLELIEDCTTPGQECYERGQRNTAAAVESINRAVVYAAACADQPGVQGQDEIYACVIRRMARFDASD